MAFSLKFLFTVTEKQCSIFRHLSFYADYTAYASVADLGEGPGGPLFWAKKEEMTEGKRANRARKSRLPHPLAQGLDPPLRIWLLLRLVGKFIS